MIKSHTIENKFLRVKTLNIGATLFEVFYKKKKINLILNLDKISSYKNNKNYLGSICGRFANRIENAKFSIKGVNYNLTKNENNNILHGGKNGFDSKLWKIKNYSKSHISYIYTSPDGEEGFPGKLKTICKYSIKNSSLKVEIISKTSKFTHVNLVNHAYWNLDRTKKDIFNHYLMINSDFHTQNNKQSIPNGKIIANKGTFFDFNKFRIIGEQIKRKGCGFNENFIVRKNSNLVAKLFSPRSKIILKIFSNQPGVQFYTGQNLKFRSKKKNIKKYQGLCLETQAFPNAPNNIKFPSTLLGPSQIYKHNIRFEISLIK